MRPWTTQEIKDKYLVGPSGNWKEWQRLLKCATHTNQISHGVYALQESIRKCADGCKGYATKAALDLEAVSTSHKGYQCRRCPYCGYCRDGCGTAMRCLKANAYWEPAIDHLYLGEEKLIGRIINTLDAMPRHRAKTLVAAINARYS